MTNEVQQPTPAEISAYEAKAHQLRAEALSNGLHATGAFLKSLVHRIGAAFARPAHA